MNFLACRVRNERLARRLSVRDVAALGGISNTWWGKFEDGVQPLTDGIINAVAKAYGWDDDWATQPDEFVELRGRVVELEHHVGQLLELAGIDAAPGRDEPREPTGDEH